MNKRDLKAYVDDRLNCIVTQRIERLQTKVEALERQVFSCRALIGGYECGTKLQDSVTLKYKVRLLQQHLGLDFRVTPSVPAEAILVDVSDKEDGS